jgi:hypothetical protein
MIAKIMIWLYIIFVVPPLAVIMAGLAYGGVVETIKLIKNEQPK